MYHGKPRKLLIEANRNGFLYVLDRTSGEFLSATPFVKKLTWAKGIDGHGRPIAPISEPSADGTLICPGVIGATNWFSPTYSEKTGLFYLMALEACSVYFRKPAPFAEGSTYYAGGTKHSPDASSQKVLLAFNPETQTFAWQYPQVGEGHSWAGVMSTATGLIFFGDDANFFEAVDAKTGKSLWHFNTGQTLHASPMSYAVNGKQNVAIASGTDLFSFALP